MGNIILETERLKVVVPTVDSFSDWQRLLSDPDVIKYIGDGNPKDNEAVKEILLKSIKHYEDFGFCLFDIYEKDSNEFVGESGLIYLALDKRNEDIEVGYTLHNKYWGKGYATELADAFIKWGFNKLNLNKIVACCIPDNTPSSNVMKKCGMNYKGKYLYNNKHECDIYHIHK